MDDSSVNGLCRSGAGGLRCATLTFSSRAVPAQESAGGAPSVTQPSSCGFQDGRSSSYIVAHVACVPKSAEMQKVHLSPRPTLPPRQTAEERGR